MKIKYHFKFAFFSYFGVLLLLIFGWFDFFGEGANEMGDFTKISFFVISPLYPFFGILIFGHSLKVDSKNLTIDFAFFKKKISSKSIQISSIEKINLVMKEVVDLTYRNDRGKKRNFQILPLYSNRRKFIQHLLKQVNEEVYDDEVREEYLKG